MVKRSSKQREIVVDVYDSADGVRGHKPNTDAMDTKRDGDTAPHTGGDTAWSRWSKLMVVCLLLLCVLLLTVLTVLWIDYHTLKAEKKSQTSNTNLTIAREQFRREREELERFLKLGWTYSSSSVYNISTEPKSWNESRKNCSERGADLVIINSREEQEFVTKLRGSDQAWIGLSYRVGENKWKWVNDTTLITGFWGIGEPNSTAGDEDCVITGETSDPLNNWAVYPCSKQYKWICEKTIFN